MSFRIHDLPAHERPRERMMDRGANALTDRELLAIILRTGTTGKSALDLAEELLMEFNGWHGLVERSPQELMQIKGISEAKAIELTAVFEIHKRMQVKGDRKRQRITQPEDAHRLYSPMYQGLRQEVFVVVCLTTRNHVISDTPLYKGSSTASVVHPREVFRIAMNANAASIMLLHNHPSGDPTPSAADIETTQRFTQAGKLLGIALLDHIILAGDRWWSILESRSA
ncbi:MAG: DNA repair protein RadC [Candidatus Uhrbacteria bacterium]